MKEKNIREIIVSGYGPGNEQEASIALYEMTGNLDFGKTLWEDRVTAPSFLCTYHDMCFGISEEKNSGTVYCYQRQKNEYVLKDKLELKGGALCHIAYHPGNHVLYASFYETGHIAAIKVENYHFTKVLSFFQIPSDIPGGLTRVHCCAIEPEGSRVFAVNIALDRIFIYDTENGALKLNQHLPYVQLEKGKGPRHLKFHPLQNYLYIITEYSNEIYAFVYEQEKGEPSLKLLQKISTLPEGFTGISYGSALDISKDGRFLYAANRGANTIAVFEIHPDGTLTKIQDRDCLGNYPRHIALSKDDSGLMIANQNSDEVVILKTDETNGMLTDVLARKAFYHPSYVEEL